MNSFYFFLLLAGSLSLPLAQDSDFTDNKPRDAFVKIINGCDTSQVDRWRTGLDLKFKGKFIGRDIRMGERGPVGKIEFTGKDYIEVFRAGDALVPIARVPALFQKGGFYTLVVTGQLEANSAELSLVVVKEFPLLPEELRPGMCHLVLLNAVRAYPVSLSIGENAPTDLQFAEQTEMFLPPGEVDMGLWFTDSKGRKQRLQAGMIAEANGNYTAIIHPSEERSDRPSFFCINATEDRKSALEMERDSVPDSILRK